MTQQPHVLVVDDEVDLAELYRKWLSEIASVDVAFDGVEALDLLDDDVDVILLDRRMPEKSGDEVLAAIERRGLDCRAAMVTAVDPDFDILEMGFDDYLTKPVTKDELQESVTRLYQRVQYSDTMQELFAKLAKRESLEAVKSRVVLQNDEQYQQLLDEIDELLEESEDHLDNLDDEDFTALFYQLDD